MSTNCTHDSTGRFHCRSGDFENRISRLRSALARVRAHTGRLPYATPKLLNELLNSIERIAENALAEDNME